MPEPVMQQPNGEATLVQTYVPLYRKYRPQAFSDVVGQQAIVQTLGNAINLGKVAHAYLFCGPRGTGKTSTARIFAKSLNCAQGPTVTPCQVCASCTGITQGNALDVVEFDAASNNKVDDARELIENAQFTPMAGRYKIYIIDEVHMLTTQAFNALLKTLEEPPPNVVFIFATTEAHKVLPTIISRCQRFDFTRITHQDITRRLDWIAHQERISIDTEALDTIARHVRGGMRDAVGLLDQVAVLGRAQQDKTITRSDVSLFIGALEEDILVWISRAIADRQPTILLQQLSELEKRGIEPAQLVKELTQHYRHLLLVSVSQRSGTLSADQLDLPDSYFQKLLEQVPAYQTEELPQILFKLSSIERNIRGTQQPQLWLEVGLLELAYREEIYLVKSLAERVAALEAQLASGMPIPTSHAVSSAIANTAAKPASSRPPAVHQVVAHQASTAPPVASTSAPPAQTNPTSSSASSPSGILPAAAPASPGIATTPTVATAAVVSAPPAAAPAMPSAAPSRRFLPDGELDTLYHRICQQVPSVLTRDLLTQQTHLSDHQAGRLTIACASESIMGIVKNPKKLLHLQKAAEKVLGENIQIELVLKKLDESATPVTTTPIENTSVAVATMTTIPIATASATTAPATATPDKPIMTTPAPVVDIPTDISTSAPVNAPATTLNQDTALFPETPTTAEPLQAAQITTYTSEDPISLSVSVTNTAPVATIAPMAESVSTQPASTDASTQNGAASTDEADVPVSLTTVSTAPVPDIGELSQALSEAKQFTMELLQGRILD